MAHWFLQFLQPLCYGHVCLFSETDLALTVSFVGVYLGVGLLVDGVRAALRSR